MFRFLLFIERFRAFKRLAFTGIVIRITFTCLTFFVLVYSEISGQLYPYHNYTIKEGLPSNNIYSIKQDSKGYIWMNTDRGVARYDGKDFKIYTISEGLMSNDNFSMLFDSKENKWLYSFKSVSCLRNNEEIRNIDDTNNHFSFFFIDSEDQIYYLKSNVNRDKTESELVFVVVKDDKIINYTCPSFNFETFNNKMYFYQWKDNIYFVSYNFKTGEIVETLKWDNRLEKMVTNTDTDAPKVPFLNILIRNPELIQIDDTYSIVLSGKEYALVKGSDIIKISPFPDNSTKFTIGDTYINNNEVFVVLQSGVYKYSVSSEGADNWENVFKYPKVTGVMKDREGNFWVSTLGEGLFKFYGYGKFNGLFQIKYISNDNIVKVHGHNNEEIYYANSNNTIKNIDTLKSYDGGLLKDFRFIDFIENGVVYGGNNAIYFNGKVLGEFAFKGIYINNDSIVFAGPFGLNFFDKNNLYHLSKELDHDRIDISGRMYAVLYENGIFYSGNQQGLYWGRPQKDELIPICLDPDLETVSVNFIRKTSDGLLWVSTEGNGVFVLRNKETIKHFYGELLDGNIHSLKIDEKDQVWIATKNGVNKIVHDKNDQFTVKKYTSFHGLPSDYVNDVYCYNDTLYAATDEGLVRMDMKEIDRTDFNQAPPVYLNRIVLRENGHSSILRSDSTYILAHDQNNLTVSYSGISFRSNGNISYLYRLMPLNKEWRQTKNDELDFSDLQAGNYTFEVKAVNALGIVSAGPARYSFVIKPHFTRTWWFLGLSLIGIVGLVFLLVYLYFRYQRIKNLEKAKLDRQLTQLKLKSLQSQLNPHFIFNSLNAIQQFVNKEDKDQANIYLARFAKLMRLYLMGSDSQFITLSQ